MTAAYSTAQCVRCDEKYPLTLNKDGTPRKRKCEGYCRKCANYHSDAKWGRLGTKKCPICGEEFSLFAENQNTCSNECKVQWNSFLSLVNADARKCATCGGEFSRPSRSKISECVGCRAETVRKARVLKNGGKVFTAVELPCGACTESFTQVRYGQAYCSTSCAQKAKKDRRKESPVAQSSRRSRDSRRRALKKTTQVERIIPAEVFERDGNICHLCKEETDAPELEHIVALSDGGGHVWSNVACSCRACNSKKGARSFGQLHLPFGPRRLWPELSGLIVL